MGFEFGTERDSECDLTDTLWSEFQSLEARRPVDMPPVEQSVA